MSEHGVSRAGSPATVLVLTLVGYPAIAAGSVLTGLPNRPLSILMRGVIVAFALDVVLRRFLMRGRVPFTSFWVLWWSFWILCVSRLLLDSALNPSALRLSVGEYLLWYVGMGLLPAVAMATPLSETEARRALRGTLLLGTAAILANLVALKRSSAMVAMLMVATGRVATETLNPIGMGHLGATMLILALWSLIRETDQRALVAVGLMVVAGLGAGLMVLAGSRGPILSVGAVMPLIAIEALRSRSGRLGHVLKLAVPGIAMCAALMWLWAHRDLWHGVERVTSGMFQDNARQGILHDAFAAIAAHPITGAGTQPGVTYPHNLIVESFLPFGVISGVLFLGILLIASRAAVYVFLRQPRQAWTTLLFIQYAAAGMVSGALYTSSALWVLSVVMVAQAAAPSRYRASPSPSLANT